MSLTLLNRQRTKRIDSRRLKKIIAELLAELAITDAELGITLVGAREMARVNWQFLQQEGSTDVITFDHRENGAGAAQIHGELYICVDDAVKQAKEFGTHWQAELVRYMVHGVLHLMGYDDLTPALRRTMKREENRLVRWLDRRFALAERWPRSKMSA